MASSCAALTGGDSTLVRGFQPLNRSNDRTPRRLVRHLVDDLDNQQDAINRYEQGNRSRLSPAANRR
jgi:hypothetical protein